MAVNLAARAMPTPKTKTKGDPKPVEVPKKPTVISTATMHTLKWEPIGRSDSKYLLEKAEKPNSGETWGPWKPYSRTAIVGTSLALSGLMVGKDYKCRVLAVCGTERSLPSEESDSITVKAPKPVAKANGAATAVKNGDVKKAPGSSSARPASSSTTKVPTPTATSGRLRSTVTPRITSASSAAGAKKPTDPKATKVSATATRLKPEMKGTKSATSSKQIKPTTKGTNPNSGTRSTEDVPKPEEEPTENPNGDVPKSPAAIEASEDKQQKHVVNGVSCDADNQLKDATEGTGESDTAQIEEPASDPPAEEATQEEAPPEEEKAPPAEDAPPAEEALPAEEAPPAEEEPPVEEALAAEEAPAEDSAAVDHPTEANGEQNGTETEPTEDGQAE